MNYKPQNQGDAFVLLSLIISNIHMLFPNIDPNSSTVVDMLVYLWHLCSLTIT